MARDYKLIPIEPKEVNGRIVTHKFYVDGEFEFYTSIPSLQHCINVYYAD